MEFLNEILYIVRENSSNFKNAKLLLSNGANINHINLTLPGPMNALVVSVNFNNFLLTKFLLENGATVDILEEYSCFVGISNSKMFCLLFIYGLSLKEDLFDKFDFWEEKKDYFDLLKKKYDLIHLVKKQLLLYLFKKKEKYIIF